MRAVSLQFLMWGLVLGMAGCHPSDPIPPGQGGDGDGGVATDMSTPEPDGGPVVVDQGGGAGEDGGGGPGPTPDMGPPPPPPRPRCTGMSGAPTGTNVRSYTTSDDLSARDVVIHVPDDLDPNEAVPILFAVHGASMSGEVMHGTANFDSIADREHFVVVYPSGTPGLAPWNVGPSLVCGAGALVNGSGDDISYIERILSDIADEQCIDRQAVFVTGFSMGGYFSNHIGCQAGDYLVRGIAPHSGGTYTQTNCPGAPLPALILHGDADPLIAASCGKKAADLWVERNGCSTTFDTIPVMNGECRRYQGCPDDAPVMHCTFDGMAHGWAGSPTDGPYGFYSGGAEYEDASELVWSFFAEQLPY